MNESAAPARPWLRPLAMLAFAFAIYGATLFLPWSFYDDVPYFLIQARETQAHLATGEMRAAFDSLMRWNENNLGPSLRLYVFVQWLAFGKAAAPWHLIKILTFFLTAWGLIDLVRALKGTTLAQTVALLAFSFFGASSGHPDFQTHFINFARLLTTDSLMTPAAIWGAVFALRPVPSSTQRVMLFVCVLWCGLTKATAVHYIGSLFLFCAFRKRGMEVLLIAAAAVPGLVFFRLWEGRPVFGYVDLPLPKTPSEIGAIATSYFSMTTEALGFTWIAAVGYGLIAAIRSRRDLFLPVLLLVSGFAIQCLWPIVYQRYAIIYTPWLCVLVAMLFDGIVHERGRALAAIAGGGVALTLLAVWPLYVDAAKKFAAGYALILVLGISFVAIATSLIAAIHAKIRNPLRTFAACAITGSLLCHHVVSLFFAWENWRVYSSFERTVWQTAVYAEKIKSENEGGTSVVATSFVAEHFNRLLSILNIAPAVTLKQYDAGPADAVMVFSAEDWAPSFIKSRASLGYTTKLLATEDINAGNLKSGQEVRKAFTLPEGTILTNLYLNADPSTWSRKLDVEILIETPKGPETIGLLRGRHITRPFMGPQILMLDVPFVVPAGITAIVLRIVGQSPGDSITLNSPSMFPGTPQPSTLEFYGAAAGTPRMELLTEYEDKFHAAVIFAPSYLLQGAVLRKALPAGMIGNSFHHYAMELYRPASGVDGGKARSDNAE